MGMVTSMSIGWVAPITMHPFAEWMSQTFNDDSDLDAEEHDYPDDEESEDEESEDEESEDEDKDEDEEDGYLQN